jgi:hypothetical protein
MLFYYINLNLLINLRIMCLIKDPYCKSSSFLHPQLCPRSNSIGYSPPTQVHIDDDSPGEHLHAVAGHTTHEWKDYLQGECAL